MYEKLAMNNYLSIITLNVNGLNAPIKRHRIAEWVTKHDPHMFYKTCKHLLFYKRPISGQNTYTD